jgi:hypothetical protein
VLNGVQLESGILLRFDLEPNAGTFHVGDYWSFAARAAGGKFELLDRMPPRGAHHHFARLAVVTFPDAVIDCRRLWPPLLEGDSCACDVCVTPEQHNSGQLTIQAALDGVRANGGTVCLEVGDYILREPLFIRESRSVRLKGKGSRSVVSYVGEGAALRIERSVDVDVRDVSFAFGAGGDAIAGGIAIEHGSALVIDGCYFLEMERQRVRDFAIEMNGVVRTARVTNNVVVCGHGFVTRETQEELDYLLIADMTVAENQLLCAQRAIDFAGHVYFLGDLRIDDNYIAGGERGAVRAVLQAHNDDLPTSRVRVSRNMILAIGDGITVGARLAEVSGNTVVGMRGGKQPAGIVLTAHALDTRAIEDGRITDNVVRDILGDGLRVDARCATLTIRGNTIERVQRSGILFDADVTVETAIIEGNLMRSLCTGLDEQQRGFAGVSLVNCQHLRFSGNQVRDVALQAQRSPIFIGVAVFGCEQASVENNDIGNIGPARYAGLGIGVVLLSCARAAFNGNRLRRFEDGPQDNRTQWLGVLIGDLGMVSGLLREFGMVAMASNWPLHVYGNDVAFRLTSKGGVMLAARPRTRAMLGDNQVEGCGGLQVLGLVRVSDTCQFQDNDFDLVQDSSVETVVRIDAGISVLASNNRVVRPGDATCLDIHCRAAQDRPPVTATGNITTSSILLNGSPLPAPWAALNIF